MRFGVTIACVIALSMALVSTSGWATPDEGAFAKFEIKKFRFRRNSGKNFERLVIEFAKKSGNSRPVVRIDAPNTGKDATIEIDQASLVGAIPEALINDSYVPRSHFLGPVSINTDGPSSGFTIRTFLKSPVSVDAFWLDHPARLVLDVFPANSPRVAGRVPEPSDRSIASTKAGESEDGPIVCYPVSSAVSAQVMFHAKDFPGSPFGVETISPQTPGPEPVICFMASSRVVPSVSYRPKTLDQQSFVQWEGNFGRTPSSEGGGLFGGANAFPAPIPPAVPQVPAPPTPPKAGGLVVPDITPGRTPLGAPLVNPATIQRLPGNMVPQKLPSLNAIVPGPTMPVLPPMAPPVK